MASPPGTPSPWKSNPGAPSPDAALLDDAAVAAPSSSSDKVVHIPRLEELQKLRVAELQQEVQHYDLSILSLQLKVKKLEEEREESLREKHQKPNLAKDSKGDRSVKDKRDAGAESDVAASLDRNGIERLKGKSVLEGELLADPEPLASFVEELEEEMVLRVVWVA